LTARFEASWNPYVGKILEFFGGIMVDNGYFMDIFHGIASFVASRNSGRDF
jgi:hypothetical protein